MHGTISFGLFRHAVKAERDSLAVPAILVDMIETLQERLLLSMSVQLGNDSRRLHMELRELLSRAIQKQGAVDFSGMLWQNP